MLAPSNRNWLVRPVVMSITILIVGITVFSAVKAYSIPDTATDFRNLILSIGKIDVAPERSIVVATNTSPGTEGGYPASCTTSTTEATNNFESIIAFDPNADT